MAQLLFRLWMRAIAGAEALIQQPHPRSYVIAKHARHLHLAMLLRVEIQGFSCHYSSDSSGIQ